MRSLQLFRPNTHRAAQEFGQFSSGWEPTGRRARASSLRTPIPAQEFGQFLTANPTQRRCIDANGKTRRPNPAQEFGQFFEERRALHWRRRTRMDSSTHPCSRIRTVLGQGRPHLIGRRAGDCERPFLLKNLDSSEWGHSYLGDRRAGCFQRPSLLKNSANGRVWARRGRQLATAAESRHVIMSDASALSPKSTPLCDSRLAPSTGMSTCCSSRRRRDLAAPSRAFSLPPFPAQEFGSS